MKGGIKLSIYKKHKLFLILTKCKKKFIFTYELINTSFTMSFFKFYIKLIFSNKKRFFIPWLIIYFGKKRICI